MMDSRTPCSTRLLPLEGKRVDDEAAGARLDCLRARCQRQEADGGGQRAGKHTDVDGKVDNVDGQHGQDNGRAPGLVVLANHQPDELAGKAHEHEAGSDDDCADSHQGPAAAPFGRVLVGNDAHDGLDNEAREGAGDPDERRVALCEAEVEEVGGAVCAARQQWARGEGEREKRERGRRGQPTRHLDAPREAVLENWPR